LDKIKDEWDGQDQNDDHEPLTMLAQNGDHMEKEFPVGAVQNLRRLADEPTAFSR
jgi:hypothetical protein